MTEEVWDNPVDLSGKTFNIIKCYKSGSGETKNQEENGFAITFGFHCKKRRQSFVPSASHRIGTKNERKRAMTGSIQRKGIIYYAVIALNGKRKWIRGGPTKKDAQRKLNERLGEVEAGTYKELPKTTFGQFIAIWERRYADMSLRPSTKNLFTDTIQRLLLPAFSDKQMSAIDTGMLQDYVSARAKIVKPNTVRNELTVLKLIFKYALTWSYVRNNPTIGVERPEIEKPEIEILSPDEFERLLQHSAMPYRVAFLTAFLTGLRAGSSGAYSGVMWTGTQSRSM
ncbi:hypothetical protein NBG4_440003 [Candidatus Sulfobium mesophilum]|uniref:Core-binding (CB) domain-containing protein n=1 Tax=Candidatus Sulfobium mesophilum TaxID=2016548 RepID=A0A2U3QI92_9BACT|nr:hypothetical protein NBG4_440003 [Candidatus Sulfobium mesophilum]